MVIKIDESGTIKGLKQILDEMAVEDSVKGILIFACSGNGFTPELLDDQLKKFPKPLFGGIFPEVIYRKSKCKRCTLVAGLSRKPEIRFIPGLSDKETDFDEILGNLNLGLEEPETAFVFVDGYSTRVKDLIESLFFNFGLDMNYIGGGAGSLENMYPSPCLLTNEGIREDGVLIAFTEIKSGIGVSHGWKKLKGPFKITEVDGRTIETLDWKPAFEVYKNVVENHSGKKLTKENFFSLAKCYPFGMSRMESEIIVRDPFASEDGKAIKMVTSVPGETFIEILTGNKESLIEAAKSARDIAFDAFGPLSNNETLLFIDCISRVLYLDDDFSREIESVYTEKIPTIGALTIGEIANSGKDYLEFFNKTSVIGILGD